MIEARRLTKRFGDVTAVDDLSFEVRPGEVVGFLGPNGSGKSTTMRLIMGLDRPTSGDVKVCGRHYQDLPWPLREVGALLEARAIHPGRSAYNHLLWLAQSNGISRRRVDEVIGLVGLSEVAGKKVGKFSLGMGQRLGIAAALLGDPGVLIFDEPINGLDPEGIKWVRELLKVLAAEGRTVFVSSHLMSEMALTASRVVVVGRGRLITQGTVAEVLQQVSSRSGKARTLVRSPRIDELSAALVGAGASIEPQPDGSAVVSALSAPEIGDLAASLGIALYELAPQQISLEDAFMELTSDFVDYRAPSVGGGNEYAPVR